MADVRVHRCFPTTVGEFLYYPNDMVVKDMEQHITIRKKNHAYHTEDDLHEIFSNNNLFILIHPLKSRYFR